MSEYFIYKIFPLLILILGLVGNTLGLVALSNKKLIKITYYNHKKKMIKITFYNHKKKIKYLIYNLIYKNVYNIILNIR